MLDRSRNVSATAAACLLGRRGGLRGGRARAESLSAKERSDIARHAARVRWSAGATERLAPAPAGRDANRMRRRILAAAVREVRAHGPSGARLARIARRAGVHPKTIHAGFGSRENLVREVFVANARTLRAAGSATPADLPEAMVFWQRFLLERPGWMRATLWEALDPPAGRLPAADERRALWRAAVDALDDMQRRGRLRPDLDPRYLQLALVSLTLMPAALPQMAHLVTGLSPSDARFREGQATFLRALGRLLAPRP
ncbi:MAG TPA: TetR family transcriptional regulator [Thermoanaerobaculia bacterium]|nr:TetR family transcriptional regulator [Thermoanaerobaculia bacterium]